MTLQQYSDYFEQLATSHADIQHDPDGSKRFCVFDPDEIGAESKFSMDLLNYCLAVKKFTVRFIRDGSHLRKVYMGGYAVFKTVPLNDHVAEKLVQSEADQICEDIFLELLNRQKCEGEGWLTIGSSTRLKLDESEECYDAEPVSGLHDNMAGFDVNIAFYEHKDHNSRRASKFL